VVQNVVGLRENAEACAQALLDGDIEQVGKCISTYWEQKKCMVGGGVEPAVCSQTLALVKADLYGATLAGAGGGGFMLMLTRKPNVGAELKAKILGGVKGAQTFSFHECEVDVDGMQTVRD